MRYTAKFFSIFRKGRPLRVTTTLYCKNENVNRGGDNKRRRPLTDKITIGVWTTISYNVGFLVRETSDSAAFCSLITIFNIYPIFTFALKFLFVNLIRSQLAGSFKFLWKVHGPGPIKLAASSPNSFGSFCFSGSISWKRGDDRKMSGEGESRGRIGIDVLSSCRRERRLKRSGVSERTRR